MSGGKRWKREQVVSAAERIRAALAHYCSRIELAGSLRRQCPEVGDIDLVLEPMPDCREAIDERCGRQARCETNGKQNARYFLANGLQLDLWFTRRTEVTDLFGGSTQANWGMRLLVSTGSREFNVALAKRAKRQGKHFAPYQGILVGGSYRQVVGAAGDAVEQYVGGAVAASATEEAIFDELRMEFVPPVERANWTGADRTTEAEETARGHRA